MKEREVERERERDREKGIETKNKSVCIIAIYNSRAFKRARTACSVHRVDSAHYTL